MYNYRMPGDKDIRDKTAEIFGLHFVDQIAEWFCEELEVDNIFTHDRIISFVADNFKPEDVFDAWTLETWAKENGYE